MATCASRQFQLAAGPEGVVTWRPSRASAYRKNNRFSYLLQSGPNLKGFTFFHSPNFVPQLRIN